MFDYYIHHNYCMAFYFYYYNFDSVIVG